MAGPGSKHQHIDQMCFKFIDQAAIRHRAVAGEAKPSGFKKKVVSEDKELPSTLSLTNQNLRILTNPVLQFHEGIYADSETDAYDSL